MPQVKATAFGAKVNVGFGLLIVMYRGVPSKNAPLQSFFAIYSIMAPLPVFAVGVKVTGPVAVIQLLPFESVELRYQPDGNK